MARPVSRGEGPAIRATPHGPAPQGNDSKERVGWPTGYHRRRSGHDQGGSLNRPKPACLRDSTASTEGGPQMKRPPGGEKAEGRKRPCLGPQTVAAPPGSCALQGPGPARSASLRSGACWLPGCAGELTRRLRSLRQRIALGRTTSTFSCDIAYSFSPTALRASARSLNIFPRTAPPPPNVTAT